MRGTKPNFSYPDMDEEYGFLPRAIPDPGTGKAIPVLHSASVNFTIAASATETNTLAAPTFAGQVMVLNAMTVGSGGSRVVTVADPHFDGTYNTITFDAAGDSVCLVGVKTSTTAFGWSLAWNARAALSHV